MKIYQRVDDETDAMWCDVIRCSSFKSNVNMVDWSWHFWYDLVWGGGWMCVSLEIKMDDFN